MGGLEVIRLLLQHPDVYIDELNLSAGLGWRGNVLQPTLLMQTLRHLPGGPILTGMVRIGQQHGVRNSPNLEQGADDRAARAAQRTSLRTTAPMLLGQVASIAAASEPPRPGSLAGRIGRVTYLRAKNPHDDLVDLDGSVKVWREAVGPNTLFEERVVAAFGDSMHTPTPERPFAAVRAVSEAANR
jgi:hypothetical protein